MIAGLLATPFVVHPDGYKPLLSNLGGPLNDTLQQIARAYVVTLGRRGSRVSIRGDQAGQAGKALEWFHRRAVHKALTVDDMQLGLVELDARHTAKAAETATEAAPKQADAPGDGVPFLHTRKSALHQRPPQQHAPPKTFLKNNT